MEEEGVVGGGGHWWVRRWKRSRLTARSLGDVGEVVVTTDPPSSEGRRRRLPAPAPLAGLAVG